MIGELTSDGLFERRRCERRQRERASPRRDQRAERKARTSAGREVTLGWAESWCGRGAAALIRDLARQTLHRSGRRRAEAECTLPPAAMRPGSCRPTTARCRGARRPLTSDRRERGRPRVARTGRPGRAVQRRCRRPRRDLIKGSSTSGPDEARLAGTRRTPGDAARHRLANKRPTVGVLDGPDLSRRHLGEYLLGSIRPGDGNGRDRSVFGTRVRWRASRRRHPRREGGCGAPLAGSQLARFTTAGSPDRAVPVVRRPKHVRRARPGPLYVVSWTVLGRDEGWPGPPRDRSALGATPPTEPRFHRRSWSDGTATIGGLDRRAAETARFIGAGGSALLTPCRRHGRSRVDARSTHVEHAAEKSGISQVTGDDVSFGRRWLHGARLQKRRSVRTALSRPMHWGGRYSGQNDAIGGRASGIGWRWRRRGLGRMLRWTGGVPESLGGGATWV